MALWLVAVIVLIAVGAMPSEAKAHAGHPHASAAVATVAASETRIGVDARIAVPATEVSATEVPASEVRASDIRTVVVLAAAPVRGLTAGPCDGSCCNAGCRSPGSCCTGAGLAPEAADAAAPPGAGERALARALPARTDVVPEALPEPPRFDA